MRLAFERNIPAAPVAQGGGAAGPPRPSSPSLLPSLAPERRDRTHSAPAEPPERTALVEIVTPRTNAAAILPAENLLGAISLPEPFSLEIAGTRQMRWFLARAGSVGMRRHLENQVGVAYPQAALRPLATDTVPGFDPARCAPDEQVAACTLVLRAPAYLPLRTFSDSDIAADRAAHAAQADPLLPILGALGNIPDGWRALSQLVLHPAPDTWCEAYQRLAVEHPLAAERLAQQAQSMSTASSGIGIGPLIALMGAAAVGLQGYQWYLDQEWLRLVTLVLGLSAAVAAVLAWVILRRAGRRPPYDMKLVEAKIGPIAYVAQLRLAVFAPATSPRAEVEAHLGHLAAAYRQFNLASGNGLRPQPLQLDRANPGALCSLAPLAILPQGRLMRLFPLLRLLPRNSGAAVLNTRELAGLWHLPQALADVPLVERTTARERLPLPCTVAQGCRIGVSEHQGRAVPVRLPDGLLGRHLLAVAKTRRGKSSLLLHLAKYLMEAGTGRDASDGCAGGHHVDDRQHALVLVDPHQDLARSALGLVPPERHGDVVFVDVGERKRPFGLNLLDTGLGWERDKAVANVLAMLKREFDNFWGPRMEDAFRFALLTLYEANETICTADPEGGRGRQHTILDVPAVLADGAFRKSLLPLVADPTVVAWWSGYWDRLDRRLQIEVQNPVATKVQRFAGSRAARAIVGQPRSTIDPAAWLRDGAIVIVNTAKGAVGENTAALIGGTVINLVGLLVSEQATLLPAARRAVTLLVDEFHTMPGADYEAILSELSKYGTNLVLATQSLARLRAIDREQQRALLPTVFANLDGLFAFHCSAEDAQYLVHELGGGLDENDIIEMAEHRCYAKISVDGERLPVFSVHLDPPPPGDADVEAELARASALRYGRDADAVDADLRAALARIAATHGASPGQNTGSMEGKNSGTGNGVAKGTPGTVVAEPPASDRSSAGGDVPGAGPDRAQPGQQENDTSPRGAGRRQRNERRNKRRDKGRDTNPGEPGDENLDGCPAEGCDGAGIPDGGSRRAEGELHQATLFDLQDAGESPPHVASDGAPEADQAGGTANTEAAGPPPPADERDARNSESRKWQEDQERGEHVA